MNDGGQGTRTNAAREAPDLDWHAVFFDPGGDWPNKLLARSRRRFGDTPDAESAYNFALDRLSHDDWAQLREHYRGDGSPSGFLAITFFNALEEYARQKYPRPRPPAWLKRLGPRWVRTWQLLCLKRELPETIVDALGEGSASLRSEIRHAISKIKSLLPNCGRYDVEKNVAHDDKLADSHSTVDAQLDGAASRLLLQIMQGLLTGPAQENSGGSGADSWSNEDLTKAVAAMSMSDDERLLLRLIYDGGHKIASAARALGLSRKKASRMHAALLRRFGQALAPLGLGGGK